MLKQLIVDLAKIYKEKGDIPFVGVCGSSGTVYEMGSAFVKEVGEDTDEIIKEIIENENVENYIEFYLGN